MVVSEIPKKTEKVPVFSSSIIKVWVLLDVPHIYKTLRFGF